MHNSSSGSSGSSNPGRGVCQEGIRKNRIKRNCCNEEGFLLTPFFLLVLLQKIKKKVLQTRKNISDT